MKPVIIIGGGLAGLSAAAYLAGRGIKTELFEASTKPGGRASGFYDPAFDTALDNGQHIMMGCYKETFRFLDLIDSGAPLYRQPYLSIDYLQPSGSRSSLIADSLPYPFNLLKAFLNFDLLTVKERMSVLKFFAGMLLTKRARIENKTVEAWLKDQGQSHSVISNFWEIICIGALNAKISEAPAVLFYDILKIIFLGGAEASRIVIPETDLTTLYCPGAVKYITSHGGTVHLGRRVTELEVKDDAVCRIILKDGEITEFSNIISALPPHALNRIADLRGSIYDGFNYSPIVSAHIKMDTGKLQLKERFYAVTGSGIHWLFIHDRYISTVTSGADEWAALSVDEAGERILSEMEKILEGFNRLDAVHIRVIKEKRATVRFTPENLNKRPGVKTIYRNLFLAGDWTNTGLPATIEGAIKSGRIASETVSDQAIL